MTKSLTLTALAVALLVAAVPARAALTANGVDPNGLDLNAARPNGQTTCDSNASEQKGNDAQVGIMLKGKVAAIQFAH